MYKKRKKIPKKTFGNFPYISVIFSVSLSLLLLGIFSFFLLSSLEVKKVIQENTEINKESQDISTSEKTEEKTTTSDKIEGKESNVAEKENETK